MSTNCPNCRRRLNYLACIHVRRERCACRLEPSPCSSLAVLLYAAMMSCLADAPGGDAFGRGLALALRRHSSARVLWLVLAALLIVAAVKGRMPVWAAVGLVVLLPLSCGAVWMASDARWPRRRLGILGGGLVAAALRTLRAVGAPAGAARHGCMRGRRRARCWAPPSSSSPAAPYVALDSRRAARSSAQCPARRGSPRRRKNSGRGNSGPRATATRPSSPGWAQTRRSESYLHLPPHREPIEPRARAGIGQVKNRQADAVAMLGQGRLPTCGTWQFASAHGRPLPGLWRSRSPGAAGRGHQDPVETISASPSISKGSLPT